MVSFFYRRDTDFGKESKMTEFENNENLVEEVAQAAEAAAEPVVEAAPVEEAVADALDEVADAIKEVIEPEPTVDTAPEPAAEVAADPEPAPAASLDDVTNAAVNFVMQTDSYATDYLKETMPDAVPEEAPVQPATESAAFAAAQAAGSGADGAAGESGKDSVSEGSDNNVIDLEPKAEITYDDFAKMQFQVGEIIACEAVPKSKKLLCSQVKIGSQVKQIVSGIKAHYSPEEMVGKKVMVLVNLKPATMAGVVSEGMLLCAEDAEGNLALMTPEKTMPAGAEIC